MYNNYHLRDCWSHLWWNCCVIHLHVYWHFKLLFIAAGYIWIYRPMCMHIKLWLDLWNVGAQFTHPIFQVWCLVKSIWNHRSCETLRYCRFTIPLWFLQFKMCVANYMATIQSSFNGCQMKKIGWVNYACFLKSIHICTYM